MKCAGGGAGCLVIGCTLCRACVVKPSGWLVRTGSVAFFVRSCAKRRIFLFFGSYVQEATHFRAGKPIVWHRHEDVPLHAYGALRFRAGSSWHADLDR